MHLPIVLSPHEAWSAAAGLAMFVGYLKTPTPDLTWREKIGGSAAIGAVFGGFIFAWLWAASAAPVAWDWGVQHAASVVVVRPALLTFDDLSARVGAALDAPGATEAGVDKLIQDAGWTVPDYLARVAAEKAAAPGP